MSLAFEHEVQGDTCWRRYFCCSVNTSQGPTGTYIDQTVAAVQRSPLPCTFSNPVAIGYRTWRIVSVTMVDVDLPALSAHFRDSSIRSLWVS